MLLSLSTKTHSGLESVSIENIILFRADHKYISVFYIKGDSNGELLIDELLKDLEEEFNGVFARVHRNALIWV